MRDEQPKPFIVHSFAKNTFVEQRRCGFGKFFDGSKTTKTTKQTCVHEGNH